MRVPILILMSLLNPVLCLAEAHYSGLQVDVQRKGETYMLSASFDTPLNKCAAYHYLVDYELAKKLPGVIESSAQRESEHTVRVDRTADETILFLQVRLHSVVRYVEKPYEGVEFTQLSGDSKTFQGAWEIESRQQGSTLKFHGQWEPNTMIPLFIIDHFAKNGLRDRFDAIAQLAMNSKNQTPACAN